MTTFLTETDRARIREEMVLREEIRRELTPSHEGRRGLAAFLNSPFFLTVVCGIAASLLGNLMMRAGARSERMLAQEQMLRDKRNTIILAVANDLPTFFSIYGSMLKQRFWLRANPKEDARDEMGRARVEVAAGYMEMYKLYLHARKPDSIISEVRAFFDSKKVIESANKEDKFGECYYTAKSTDDLVSCSKDESAVRDILLKEMVSELRGQQL